MKRNPKKDKALEIMTAMHQAQNDQFRAATNLAIGVLMKKNGITQCTIEPQDLELLVKGEQIGVTKTQSGGLCYQFIKTNPETLQ